MFIRLVVVAAASCSFACDQLTATVQAGAVLTRTPELDSVLPDELLPVLPLDTVLSEGATGIVAALGERDSATSTEPPSPIDGAEVSVEWTTKRVTLCAAREAGTYEATSVPTATCGNSVLAYQASTKYVVSLETADELYTITVEPPPPVAASAVTFSPALSVPRDAHGVDLRTHPRNTALTVDWSAAVTEEPAFVTLFRINYVGGATDPDGATSSSSWQAEAANPIFDTFPKGAGDIIDLVKPGADPETSVTIPRERLATTGVYLLVVTPAEISTDVSNNLSVGSGAIAGQGTAFAFWIE